jgi:hypothetical protein
MRIEDQIIFHFSILERVADQCRGRPACGAPVAPCTYTGPRPLYTQLQSALVVDSADPGIRQQ